MRNIFWNKCHKGFHWFRYFDVSILWSCPTPFRLLVVWNPISRGQSERQSLQKLHNRCARIIMNFKDELGQPQLALDQLGWKSFEERRKHIMARLRFKVVNNLAPSRFSSMFQNSNHTTVIIYEVQIRLSCCHDQIQSMAENVSDIVGLKSEISETLNFLGIFPLIVWRISHLTTVPFVL